MHPVLPVACVYWFGYVCVSPEKMGYAGTGRFSEYPKENAF